jgi:hypothetical protein
MESDIMNEADTSVAENKISKQGSVVVAQQESMQCYFRPETEEYVFIAPEEAAAFENHWREMETSMDEFHQANENYSRAMKKYADAALEMLSIADTEELLAKIDVAEEELEKKKKALTKLDLIAQKGLGYKDVVELIPMGGQGAKNRAGRRTSPMAYANKGYFDRTRSHKVSVKAKDKHGGGESIYSRDKNGKIVIDTEKLKSQLTTLKKPTLKIELKDALKWMGADKALENLHEDYTLFDWAESWNNSLKGVEEDAFLGVDVSGSAQFMRFVSNTGASAEFDMEKKRLTIKGEHKRILTVASGVANFSRYFPDRMGWKLAMQVKDKGTVDLGMFRLCLDLQASGFIGSSLHLETQLQVMMKGDQQIIAGQSGDRLPRFRHRRTTGLAFHQQMSAEDEGLQVSGEQFRGGRVEIGLKGSFQWLKPTPPPSAESPAPPGGILKSAGIFTDFCSIGGSIGGLVGVGAGGKFHCTFINGKFCFHIAASLCWGAGAKGGLIAEVGVANIVEFGAWLVYQLYSLNYGFFEVVNLRAFEAYSQYCVMQIDKVGDKIYQGYGDALKTADDVTAEFKKFIAGILDDSKKVMEASEGRNRLAGNIIEFKLDLLRHTPEAKGILLYLLTRHGKADHIDPDNRTLSGDIYRDRKEAVICVLTSIQTVAEWNKVMCRMTIDGSSLRNGGSEAEVVEEQTRHLVRFLQEGYNRDKDLHKIYKRLKAEVALGYALAMNDTAFYQLNSLPNPHFPQRCQFGPCDGESGQFV